MIVRTRDLMGRASLTLAFVALAGISSAQRGSAESQIYSRLKNDTIFVQPGLPITIDTDQVESVAKEIQPRVLKVIVVRDLGSKWVRNGQERVGAFAQYVNNDRLNLDGKGLTIVMTSKKVIGYADGVSQKKLSELGDQAWRTGQGRDATPVIVNLARNVNQAAPRVGQQTSVGTSSPATYGGTTTNTSSSSGSTVLGWLVGIGIVGGGAWYFIAKAGKKRKLAQAKERAEKTKSAATDALAYLDSYDGLLNPGDASEAVRQYRKRMGDNYEQGIAEFDGAKNEIGYGNSERTFTMVLQDFERAQEQVKMATGGTGVAYRIPPVIDPQNAPLLEPVKGVSFFSSQPSDQLVPIEVVINGQRRTVMVTPQERDEFQRGNVPQMLGTSSNGGFQPWYDNRGYDPYRDYAPGGWGGMGYGSPWSYGYGGWGGYGGGWGSGLDGMLLGYGLGSVLSGGWGHHGHYGDYGNTTIINNYGNGGGDFDFSGGSSGGDFDFGGGSGGDFNFGGGDSGGGFDFGGGDSGGGFDFGGGDSGGGDW